MNKQTLTYHYKGILQLESGKSIRDFPLAYTIIGKLNANKDNVVWIFHAMTANSDPSDWWEVMVGENKFFDPASHFIVCVNMPGSCYGSVNPLSTNPDSGEIYYRDFPFFTPLDMARAYEQLRVSLGIESIWMGIGGSMGGQQLLAWACEQPSLFTNIVPIATNAFHSPWGKAFNASQRMCIEADSSWKENIPDAGMEGLKVARSIALISYRHYDTYGKTQQDTDKAIENTRSESYQKYQGEKLAKRFNAWSYYMLTKSMDSHHLGRGVIEAEEKLERIKSKTLVIAISSDLLYPVIEQEFLAKHISGAKLEIIDSFYGHDGFLLEDQKLTKILKQLVPKN
ncbi:MAG: homoserine O-acetyltransferase [Bacteroidota bacterium]|jgi:homoserine O-acetyltransferase